MTLSAPNVVGVELITIRLDDPTTDAPWLQYDWVDDATTAYDDNPSAEATFGIFEGNPVQIYIQQIYQ